MDIKDLNAVFSFEDAVKVVENILEETKQERDSYGPVDGKFGLWNDWDAYYRMQRDVDTIQAVLDSLMEESSVLDHVDATDRRNGL